MYLFHLLKTGVRMWSARTREIVSEDWSQPPQTPWTLVENLFRQAGQPLRENTSILEASANEGRTWFRARLVKFQRDCLMKVDKVSEDNVSLCETAVVPMNSIRPLGTRNTSEDVNADEERNHVARTIVVRNTLEDVNTDEESDDDSENGSGSDWENAQSRKPKKEQSAKYKALMKARLNRAHAVAYPTLKFQAPPKSEAEKLREREKKKAKKQRKRERDEKRKAADLAARPHQGARDRGGHLGAGHSLSFAATAAPGAAASAAREGNHGVSDSGGHRIAGDSSSFAATAAHGSDVRGDESRSRSRDRRDGGRRRLSGRGGRDGGDESRSRSRDRRDGGRRRLSGRGGRDGGDDTISFWL
jgi:hypothetical protein